MSHQLPPTRRTHPERRADPSPRPVTASTLHDRRRSRPWPGALIPCGEQDPDLWFSEWPDQLEVARAYCLECPLRASCLAVALARAEPWGVWGGEIFLDGEVVAHKRGRGRPRKHAAARLAR